VSERIFVSLYDLAVEKFSKAFHDAGNGIYFSCIEKREICKSELEIYKLWNVGHSGSFLISVKEKCIEFLNLKIASISYNDLN